MASTSSSSSYSTTHYAYEVFLSFRGEDTRNSFTGHLYKALHEAGIRTFRDDEEIREGQELKPEIERSIRESRASIIVFSKNFANSSWCLDELWLILDQRRKGCHLVVPVFYGVDPSHVRNQQGSFMIEAKGVEGSKWSEDNVNRWKAALTEVANLKGMVVSGCETAFIADIVHKIYCELGLKFLSTPTDLTGIEDRAEGIKSWLKNELPGSPVLAICGMGGSGKTTLAKYIYNSCKQDFECSSFLDDIENQPGALLGLQKQLLRDVLGNNILISNVSEGTFLIQIALQRKRVLIVVDDIDDPDKLSTLFGTKVIDTQSKIIITTRLLNIDTWFGSISNRCHVHKIELLNDNEFVELLSCHAFGSKIPMEGFEELAVQLAQYCGGNPLALKVLGSSLSFRADDQWTKSEMIKIWRSRMNSLNTLNGDLGYKIQGVLQRSFESLPCDNHKELFLHIACLFVGESAYEVENTLENYWHAKSGIMTLIDRCLITKSKGNGTLAMHKLIQDMGRRIVHEESKDPTKRSRVWRYDESYRLLRKGDGSETIEALALDMTETFKTSSIAKMKNLKFLHLSSVKLTGSYKNFPDLIWLKWHSCNLKTLPLGILMSSLVALHMSFGDLEKFEPPMVLHLLKLLDLSYSYKLVGLYSLHRLPKLESLFVRECFSLTHVCKTIGDLENLSFLDLGVFTKLWKASSNQNFVKQLERLKASVICGGIPEQPLVPLPQSLSAFVLSGNLFEILPSHIDLRMLQLLDLSNCLNLKSLSCLPSTLKVLIILWCPSLERITFEAARFTLKKLNYEGCFKLCEIEGLFKLVPIEKLDEADLEHMQWIKAYQNHKVDLVGDLITKGRTFNIQMLYEYGIRSTYLQGIKDQSMMAHEYMSPSGFVSFSVPSHPKKHRIQGLQLMFLYGSSSRDHRDMWYSPLFAKISNRTNGLSWVYTPLVFCKPRFDEDAIWLSYWPIGNALEAGDEVHVNILEVKGKMIARGCGASLVYMNDGEVESENKGDQQVIGGNLSLFEVTEGAYFLCRRDFKSKTPVLLKRLFGDNLKYADSPRSGVVYHCPPLNISEMNDLQNPKHKRIFIKLGVNFNSERETDEITKAVASLMGVETCCPYKEIGMLTVCGRFDPQAVVKCVKEFEKMVMVLAWKLV